MLEYCPILDGIWAVHSLSVAFLEALRLTPEQGASLRAVGEYQGKQALFFQQAPENAQDLAPVGL